MNRKERRALARSAHLDARAVEFASSYRCPDCDSRTALEVDEQGVHHMHVYHHATCPRLNGVTR